MNERMPCSITDGPQEDDFTHEEIDEDTLYEEQRQAEIDAKYEKIVADGLNDTLLALFRNQAG